MVFEALLFCWFVPGRKRRKLTSWLASSRDGRVGTASCPHG